MPGSENSTAWRHLGLKIRLFQSVKKPEIQAEIIISINKAEFLLPGMLKTKEKSKAIEAFRTHEKDTGSSEVQVAILTEQISQLTAHLKKNPKDNHSRRGLLGMVAKRKNLMDYLAKHEPKRHASVAKKLGLKK